MGLGLIGHQVLHPVPAVDLGHHGRVRAFQTLTDLLLDGSDGLFHLLGPFQVHKIHRSRKAAAQFHFLGGVFPDSLGGGNEPLDQTHIPLGHSSLTDGVRVRLEKIQAFLGRGQGVGQVGEDLPDPALGLCHMPESVQDDPLFVGEDDVAVFPGKFQDQMFGDDLPFRPDEIHIQGKDPVQALLGHPGDPAFLQVLPQQHAEAGGQVRPLRQGLRQGDERGGPVHVDQKIHRTVQPVHLQQQGFTAGHEDLENFSAA